MFKHSHPCISICSKWNGVKMQETKENKNAHGRSVNSIHTHRCSCVCNNEAMAQTENRIKWIRIAPVRMIYWKYVPPATIRKRNSVHQSSPVRWIEQTIVILLFFFFFGLWKNVEMQYLTSVIDLKMPEIDIWIIRTTLIAWNRSVQKLFYPICNSKVCYVCNVKNNDFNAFVFVLNTILNKWERAHRHNDDEIK